MGTIELGAENFERTLTETEQSLAAAAPITSIPTLMAFKHGSLVFTQPGALPADALKQVITAVREFDTEQIRFENQQPRSA